MRLSHQPLVEDYILEADRDDRPTVFTIRSLDDIEVLHFLELLQLSPEKAIELRNLADAAKGRALTGSELDRISHIIGISEIRKTLAAFAFVVAAALVRIRGLQDREGNRMDDIGPADFARCAPPDVLLELGSKIVQVSQRARADVSPSAVTIH